MRTRSRRRKRNSRRSKGHSRNRNRPAKMKTLWRLPRTAKGFFAAPEQIQDRWISVANVVSRMRDRVSLTKASKEFGVEPSVVIQLGRPALRKKNGRYVATKTDRLLRVLIVLSTNGKKEIATRDSRQASLVGGHWAAVQRYLDTGDDSAVQRFKGKKVTDASGRRHALLTDLQELVRQGSAGVLRFESMYAAGGAK
jgi:hypothetical protein